MEFYESDYRALLSLIQRNGNQHDSYAVRRTCHELSRIVMQRQLVRLEMVSDGVLPILSSTVSRFANDAVVMTDCCRFLRRLISLKEPNALDIQSKITEAGFLPLLSNALQDHDRDTRLFEEVCKLLVLMCFDAPYAPHADNQVAAAEAGFLRVIAGRLQDDYICEQNAIAACEAIGAITFENEHNVNDYFRELNVLKTLVDVFVHFKTSQVLVITICQILFQILTIFPEICTEVIELQFIERVIDVFKSNLAHIVLVQWHALKFLEVITRHDENAKDEFCGCRGAFTIINAIQLIPSTSSSIKSLYYMSCMLFCRITVDNMARPLTSGSKVPVLKCRVDQLLESGAHQYAVRIIQSVGISTPEVTEQALLLLDRIASIEANRILLTRLGVSRHIKLIYNSTNRPGLHALCGRAATAIDGT